MWVVDLRAPGASLSSLLEDVGSLDPEELARAHRFLRREHRENFIAAHVWKRRLRAQHLGCAPKALRFGKTATGKTVLMAPCAEHAVHFNLSHSQSWSMLAVSHVAPVGVDIQIVSPSVPFLAVAQRYFHADEVAAWAPYDEVRQRWFFYRAWVAKEAVLKARGTGLHEGLARYQVPATQDDEVLIAGWQVRWVKVADDCHAALAVPALD